MRSVSEQAKAGKEAWQQTKADDAKRSRVLRKAAEYIDERRGAIKKANAGDLARAKENNISQAMQDRLRLSDKRIDGIISGLRDVAAKEDPLNKLLWERRLPNGLRLQKVTVPLGLIGMIYEARPNVTAEASSLIFKAGNAVLLRGGSAARQSNEALTACLQDALRAENLDPHLIQLLEDPSRDGSRAMMRCHEWIDVLVPRGGRSLIRQVIEDSTVPVIRTGEGNCHTYLDEGADLGEALKIVVNAKMQRPSVCNAMETFLIHEREAEAFLPMLAEAIGSRCELRLDKKAKAILGAAYKEATEEDYATEYNDYILAVKVVSSLDEAMAHIARYGTMHSEAILTRNPEHAEKFLNGVDAAAVYLNASTRFTDGGEFGLGGELGISTQKLHARGPMGLEALVSYKYKVYGEGQIRN